MARVRSNGYDLWYDVQGEGEPLTLIGGYALLHNQWDNINEYLVPHHRVVHWNQRGAGNSDWTLAEPYSVDQWADDLKAVLDDAGIERTSIWTTSTGSATGIRFAAKYPERMNALVTYPWFRADKGWQDIFRATNEIATVFGFFTLARVYTSVAFPRDLLYTDAGRDFEAYESEAFERNVNPRTIGHVLTALSNVDLGGDVASLSCPTMVLIGGDSTALNAAAADEALASAGHDALVDAFVALKPDAEVIAVPGTGSTYTMIMKPEETAEIVVDYLRRVREPVRA